MPTRRPRGDRRRQVARHPLDLRDYYLGNRPPDGGTPVGVNRRQYGWSATLMEPAEDLMTEMTMRQRLS